MGRDSAHVDHRTRPPNDLVVVLDLRDRFGREARLHHQPQLYVARIIHVDDRTEVVVEFGVDRLVHAYAVLGGVQVGASAHFAYSRKGGHGPESAWGRRAGQMVQAAVVRHRLGLSEPSEHRISRLDRLTPEPESSAWPPPDETCMGDRSGSDASTLTVRTPSPYRTSTEWSIVLDVHVKRGVT